MAMSLRYGWTSSGASSSTSWGDSPNDFWREVGPEEGRLALEDDAFALVVVAGHGEDGEGHLGRLRLASVTAGVGGDRSRLRACHSPSQRSQPRGLSCPTHGPPPQNGRSRDPSRPRRVA